jgi:F0F1-type ATP synthase delta subunit
VLSAHPLDEAAQARLTAELGQVLGLAPSLAFGSDAALIAGLELHFAHGVLGLSWAAELRAAEALLRAAGETGAAPGRQEAGA